MKQSINPWASLLCTQWISRNACSVICRMHHKALCV